MDVDSGERSIDMERPIVNLDLKEDKFEPCSIENDENLLLQIDVRPIFN